MRYAMCGTRLAAVFAAALLAAPSSWAQTRQIQGGNALDANPQVGSGGINFAAPRPQINRANAIMTRDVGSGMGFRGYSPIRDTSQFFIDLPSSSLSPFNAQSMGVGALQQGISNYEQHYYYAPTKAVTSVSGLQRGNYLPGVSTPRTPFDYPRERFFTPVVRDPITLQPFGGVQPTGTGLAVEPGIQRVAPTGVAIGETTRFNERLLVSPLFGRTYDVPVSQLRQWSDATRGVPGTNREALAKAGKTPLQVEPTGGQGAIQSPLDRVLGGGPVRVSREVDYAVDARVRAAEPSVPTGEPASLVSAQRPLPAAALQPTAEPEWLGRDRFQDMAAAARAVREQALGVSPRAETAAGEGPGAAWAQDYVSRPITSFAGSSPTAVNDYLRRAEQDMRVGKYYRAAGLYEMASRVDPASPLPVVGQSQALIAAGEYLSAVNLLSNAIEKFPGIAYFRIDLKAFISDPRVIDSRRADLERLLKQNEDYRLRFLLGYLEYYSGYTLPGLDDLAKAGLKAPAGSPIARFLELLKQGKSGAPVPGAAESKTPPAKAK